jgi:D-alanine-D-alanine ligase-like ATP-grasp enzyme
MKKYFEIAGVKFAKFALSDNYDDVIRLTEEVGYPIFVKPNIGVGASGTRRIKNIEDLNTFYSEKDNNQYIFEQFIDGEIFSFDGITNSKGEIIFKCAHKFLEANDLIYKDEIDDAYFTYKRIPPKLNEIGESIVKAFNLKSRCFHIEIFKLKRSHKDLGKKGQYIALEVNMRPAGGYTPDLISYAMNVSYYDVYADMIKYDENRQDMSKEKFYAMSVSRRDKTRYKNDIGDIFKRYQNNIVMHGRYPESIRDIMGDFFIMARFRTLKEADEFQKIVREKLN